MWLSVSHPVKPSSYLHISTQYYLSPPNKSTIQQFNKSTTVQLMLNNSGNTSPAFPSITRS